MKDEDSGKEKIVRSVYVSKPPPLYVLLNKGKKAIEAGNLVYTCNCGWVDTLHANPNSLRQYIGVRNLWNQILSGKEKGQKSKSKNESGFKVTYRQDMGKSIFRTNVGTIGKTKHYFVKSGLSEPAKESVALAIFIDVSYAFETLQGNLLNLISPTSFSVEDLVSNLIGFYKVVRPQNDYMKLCGAISDKKVSHKVWERYHGAVGLVKNKSFRPVYFNCDECTSKGLFPHELQEIKLADKGTDFRDWLESDNPTTQPGFPPVKPSERKVPKKEVIRSL